MKSLGDIKKLYAIFEDRYNYKITNAKQGSGDWFNLKLGVVSASNVNRAVAKKGTATRDTYLHELVAQVCTGLHSDVSSAAMEWGTTNEDAARATFEMMNETKLTELTFVFKDDKFREGASPDAVDEWGGGVEIKCPYNSVHHIAFAASDKIKPEYNWQLQYTMRVFETDHWTFCSYDPRMKKNPLATMVVKRDEEMQKKMEDAIPEFISDMDIVLKSLGFEFGEQWQTINKAIN